MGIKNKKATAGIIKINIKLAKLKIKFKTVILGVIKKWIKDNLKKSNELASITCFNCAWAPRLWIKIKQKAACIDNDIKKMIPLN